MSPKVIPLLQRLKGSRLWLIVTIGSVLAAELIVSVMGLLLKGEVTSDYLLTGLVTAGIVAPPSLALLSYLLQVLARQQQEAVLAESRNLLQTIIDTAPIRVFWKDQNLRYLGCNPAFARDAGKTHPNDVIGKDDYQLAWADQADAYRADDRDVLASEAGKLSYEEPQTTPDGKIIWLRTSKVPLRNHENRTIGVLGIYEDITAYKQAGEALRESEARSSKLASLLRLMCDNVPDMIWAKDLDSRYLFANKAMCTQLLGAIDTEEPLGKTDLFFAQRERARHPENPRWHTFGELCLDTDTITLEQGRSSVFEESGNIRGEPCFLDVHKAPFLDEQGAVIGTVGSARDITERKAVEQSMRIAATAFESQEGMFITDATRVIVRVNHAFSEITGYSADEAIGRTPWLLRSGLHDAAFYAEMMERIESSGVWLGEVWNRRKSGEVYPEWLTITAVKNTAGAVTNYVATLTDITFRKETENQIRHLAFYDPLTHLPNRRLMLDRLEHALASSARHHRHGALMLIDMDNFKALNDTLGHDVGDQLLLAVASRLESCIREDDTVARLGGDEFVVILEDLDQAGLAAMQAESVGRKILLQLSQPYPLDLILSGNKLSRRNHHCSSSIGITLFRDHPVTVDELMKRADTAMYQAKAAGRNTLRFFDPDMQAAVAARAALEVDLRNAIVEQQFLLYYQAQVDASGKVLGAEVLLRWQHPEHGLVLPAKFISLAEEIGLILPLGQWVLETACLQLAAWATRPEMAQLTLAVNVSARQFRDEHFVAQVLAALEHSGANPERLKLELTESLLLEDVEEVINNMTVLKAKGVGFSLDDFGTGYSSLAYLKRLPLDQLKIDQSFVRDVLTDPNDAAIARTVVALGQSLGLAVIAEGVESGAQRAFLVSIGCHAYQGYFFSRPLPLAAFEAFLQRHWRPAHAVTEQ